MLVYRETLTKRPYTDKHTNKNVPKIECMRLDDRKDWSLKLFWDLMNFLGSSEAMAELLVMS